MTLWHFAHLSINFSGVKRSEIWPRFLTPVAFEAPSFGNRVTRVKSKTKLLSTGDGPVSSPNLVRFGPCSFESIRMKGPLKCVEPSGTQPCIAWFCWNLVDWCIMVREAARLQPRATSTAVPIANCFAPTRLARGLRPLHHPPEPEILHPPWAHPPSQNPGYAHGWINIGYRAVLAWCGDAGVP